MFLFLFGNMISVTKFQFLLKQKRFLFEDKLLLVIQHGFLRSAENVYIHNFFGAIWENIIPHNFIWWNEGRCYCLFVADVNATI